MKKLIGISAIAGGLLLMIVPRYLLPACEYEGFSRMHCSDTAEAELILGAVLSLTGIATLFTKWRAGTIAGGSLALALLCISFFLPSVFGYCQSSRMPCHYGMVPGIRFIGVFTGLIMMIALLIAVREYRKRGNS